MGILEKLVEQIERLNVNLEALNAKAPATAPVEKAADTKPAKTPKEPPKPSTPGPATPEKPAALTYDKDVKPVLQKLMAAKGKPALAEVLKSFGAANGQALKEEQFAEVIASATAAASEEDLA